MEQHLTIKELKAQLLYDPLTGLFTRFNGKAISLKPDPTTGYLRITLNYKRYFTHRLAWFYVYEKFPDKIDHKDGNRTNNSIRNLRDVTASENQRNLTLASNNTSGVLGVSFSKGRGKWEAKIQVNGKTIHLGRYLDKNDAIVARLAANKKYEFHTGHGKKK